MKSKGPFIVPWRCTTACTSSCLHCGFALKPFASDRVDTAGGMRVVDEIYDIGASWFGLSGGEPLLRSDVFEIIGHAKDIGLKVSMITRGLFSQNTVDKLVRNEVRVSISIDGTKNSNDAIRGDGAYDSALSAIKDCSRTGVLDCLVTTFVNITPELTNITVEDVKHVISLAKEYGARWVIFHGFIPFIRARRHLDLAPSPIQYEKIWNTIYDLREKHKGKPELNVYCPFFARIVKERGMADFDYWFENVFLGRCFIAGKYISVVENGDTIPCSFNDRYRFGNVKDRKLKEIWGDLQDSEFCAKLRDRQNLKGKCGVCEYREICGGCRTRAEIYTGDIFASDPACGYTPKLLREGMHRS